MRSDFLAAGSAGFAMESMKTVGFYYQSLSEASVIPRRLAAEQLIVSCLGDCLHQNIYICSFTFVTHHESHNYQFKLTHAYSSMCK